MEPFVAGPLKVRLRFAFQHHALTTWWMDHAGLWNICLYDTFCDEEPLGTVANDASSFVLGLVLSLYAFRSIVVSSAINIFQTPLGIDRFGPYEVPTWPS